MADTRRLPVGIEDYEQLRRNGFYYVDKTGLIEDILDHRAQVHLFTRPRRFGKTLNMSMLRHYLEIGTDPALFAGLRIAKRTDLCAAYMGRYPVVFVSLKDVEGPTFEDAVIRLKAIIREEAIRHSCLVASDKVSPENLGLLAQLRRGEIADLAGSLRLLSMMLCEHYEQRVILLIDEYDVPLDKALQNGYYKEMVGLIRSLLGQALKTNPYLYMAVLTGCLRVSKESIFTGLNNLKVSSIADIRFDEHYGFTDTEVRQILADYGLTDHYEEMKEWYDGYRFGNADIYCPWDVINYVDILCDDREAEPQAFWINTSGNALVKRFIDKADKVTQDEIERLIAGEAIDKRVRLELTYEEIDSSIDNLWSVLYTTGYLTVTGRPRQEMYRLVIPNREVREVFVDQIRTWFRETILSEESPLRELSQAFLHGATREIEDRLNEILDRTISIQDTRAREGQKENFYHGLLLGLLRSNPRWMVRSNVEAGDGFSDIVIEPDARDIGIVIEIKYAQTFQGLDGTLETALRQIQERRYEEYFRGDGREKVLSYGIAFCKKRCRVAML